MHSVELGAHQQKAVDLLDNGKILCGGVGVGKSRTALAYYVKREAPRDVYIITTANKRDKLDWVVEASPFGLGTARDATLHGVLKVDSWNNIGKYTEVEDAFFIFDEQRLVGSGAWTKSFLRIAKRNRWILLSATPGDTWLDYIPVFVANGFYKNRTEFKREHVVYRQTYSHYPTVERYIGVHRLVRLRNSLLVEMPYVRHTRRIYHDLEAPHDVTTLKRGTVERWHVYEQRPLRDAAELYSVARKIVNSDSSRIQMIRTLLQDHPRLIVFYNFDYELDLLRTLSGSVSTRVVEESWSKESTSQSMVSTLSEVGSDSVSRPSGSSTGHTTTTLTGTRSTTQIDESERTESCLIEPSKSSDTNSPASSRSETPSSPRTTTSTGTSTDSSRPLPSTSPTFSVSEWNGHKHEPVPTTDSWVYLVQYQAGAEGWNCVSTDTIVFYSLTYSYKLFAQAQGRIDRLNTKYVDLHYYILKSKSWIDAAIWKSLENKESFQESKMSEL